MKITQLDIEGFRSLKNVSWKPGDLNVIIGPNGSGKSNLMQFLELLTSGAKGTLSQYIQSQGGINALLWDGRADRIKFELRTSLPQQTRDEAYKYESSLVVPTAGASYRVVDESLIGYKPESFSLLRANELTLDYNRLRWTFNKSTISDEEFALSVVGQSILSGTPGAEPQQHSNPITAVRTELQSWALYSDMRVDRGSTIRQAVVTRYERQLSGNGENLINVLHTLYAGNRYFKRTVNSAMQAAFGADFEELDFPPAADQRIQLRVRWKTLQREQSASDLSDGTLRFLFLLAVLNNPDPPPLIAIEEPEIGLHPSMLPIIAEYAVDAAQRTQVIMTTHSDQFLDAFGDIKPTTTVAKWENGETTLTVLGEDELAYWLKEYSLGKLFRTGELEAMA